MDGLTGRRVLVVGINYSPEHTGIAPYTTQACNYLAAAGAEVFVLAGVPHYPHWTTPDEYRGGARTNERHGAVQVRRLRHSVPQRQTAFSRAMYEATFGLHAAVQRLPWTPDVVLGVIPSLLGSIAAAVTAHRTGAPLVLWVQDLMGPATAQSGIAGGGRVSRVTHALEGWVFRRAAAVLIVSEAFSRHLQGAGVAPCRLHFVPNWTHVQPAQRDRASVRRRLGWGDDQFVALHCGNMGLKQGLDNIVSAARLAAGENSNIRWVLMGDGSQRQSLENLARGVQGLQMLPPADGNDFPDVLTAADVLLVNERAGAVDMSLPSKLTSYFSAAVAVVAAVPPGGGTASEVERSGGGRLVAPDNPAQLFAAVRDLGGDPQLRAALGQAGGAHAREHLDETASLKRLSEAVALAISDHPGRIPLIRRYRLRSPPAR